MSKRFAGVLKKALMSHVLELTEEEYSAIVAAAAKTGQTPQQLMARMANALTEAEGMVYYTEEELLRALGASGEELEKLASMEGGQHGAAHHRA